MHLWVGLSGAAGMGLQLTWMRRLALDLGAEMPAVLGVVLAVFAGLAAGAWVLGRVVVRTRHPARWAVGLETGAAFWALVTPHLLPVIPVWFPGPESGGSGPWIGMRPFGIAIGLAGPASMALGAGLAAAERLAVGLGHGRGRMGGLYAASAAGSAVGAVMTLILLQPWAGYSTTFRILSGCLLVSALGYVRWWNHRVSGVASGGGVRLRPRLALSLFASGLLGLGYEVVLVRALSELGIGSVFSHALILLVWLGGTAAGAAFWRGRTRIVPGTDAIPLGPLVWILAGVALGGLLLAWMARPGGWNVEGGGGGLLVGFGWILVLAGPATFGMGGLFSAWVEQVADEGAGVGPAMAWNTLGCAAAPLVVGVGLLPHLATSSAVAGLLVGYGILGGVFRRWALVLSLAGGVAIWMPGAGRAQDRVDGGRRLELRRGVSETAAVWQGSDGNRVLVVNGRYTMGGTASTNGAIRQAQVPLLLHPSPRSALFLGFGTGVTAASAGWHDGLEIDAVEISPEVAALRSHFRDAVPDPGRWRLRIADARLWVRSTPARYDVIVGDLFHPGRDGAAGLFTREHFAAVRTALRPGGVACQWLPLYQLDPGSLGGVIRAWESVFPGSQVWWLRWNVDVPVIGLVGGTGPLRFGPGWFGRRVPSEVLRTRLRSVGLGDEFQLFGGWLGEAARIPWATGEAWLPTDDRPWLAVRVPWFAPREGTAVRERVLELGGAGFEAGTGPWDPSPGAADWQVRLQAYRRARDAYLTGLAADASGDRSGAETAFLSSLRASPDFPSAYSQLLSRAMGRMRDDPDGARRLLGELVVIRPENPVAKELMRRIQPMGTGR